MFETSSMLSITKEATTWLAEKSMVNILASLILGCEDCVHKLERVLNGLDPHNAATPILAS